MHAPMPELYRRARGHRFYPTAAETRSIPKLYAADGQGDAATVHMHFFNAGSDWYMTEYDPANGEAFGWAVLNGDLTMAELGYFDLPALESLSSMPGVLVERDCYWKKRPLGAVREQRERRR